MYYAAFVTWLLVVLTVSALIGLPLLGGYFWAKADCNRLSDETGVEVRFKLIGGCYVQHGDQFVPEDTWWNLNAK